MQLFSKDKIDLPLVTGAGPYLHDGRSNFKTNWHTLAVMLPVFLSSFFVFGWNALRIYAISMACAIFFEAAFQKATRQKIRVSDGSSLLIAVLFSWLMPETVPVYMIILGVFMAVICAKEMFGGFAQHVFHPVACGWAVVLFFFPSTFSSSFFWSSGSWFGAGIIFLIFFSGIILWLKKLIRWEGAFFYLLSAGFARYGANLGGDLLDLGLVLMAAFFLMTDMPSSCMTKKGRILIPAIAGFMSVALSHWMSFPQATVSAVLLSNAIAPLMETSLESVYGV